MRATRSGWLLVAGAAAALAVGRIFGILELSLLGIAGIVLVVVTALDVGRRSPITVRRAVAAGVVVAGESVDVIVEVVNPSGHPTRPVILREPAGRGVARLNVPPLRPRGAVTDRYRLDDLRRGRTRLGPLAVRTDDPFGLFEGQAEVAPSVEVLALPPVVPLVPLTGAGERSSPSNLTAPPRGAQPGEWIGLRPYVAGDDLRRVHWKASARLDDLVVLEEWPPASGTVTVVLDAHRSSHPDAASLDDACAAAASVLAATAARGRPARLVVSDGSDSGHVTGRRAERLRRTLAEVEAGDGEVAGALARAGRRRRGHLVVVSGAMPAPRTRAAVAAARPDIVIAGDTTGWGGLTVAATGGRLAATWTSAVERLSPTVERGVR